MGLRGQRNRRCSSAERLARRNASCAVQRTCVGQQNYIAASNTCEQPDCGAFFQTLLEEAGVCAWSGTFKGFVTLLLVEPYQKYTDTLFATICQLALCMTYLAGIYTQAYEDFKTLGGSDVVARKYMGIDSPNIFSWIAVRAPLFR